MEAATVVLPYVFNLVLLNNALVGLPILRADCVPCYLKFCRRLKTEAEGFFYLYRYKNRVGVEQIYNNELLNETDIFFIEKKMKETCY